MAEPHIVINGVPLNDAQAMTVRVAIENFASTVNELKDELGFIS